MKWGKRSIIESTMEELRQEGLYVPGESKVMIIDEVQKGGTISQVVHMLRDVLNSQGDDRIMSVVAVQDRRYLNKGLPHALGFREIALNEVQGVTAYTVPTHLFTVDVPEYLNAIARAPGGDDGAGIVRQLQVVPNHEARELFAALARGYDDPTRALQELDEVKESELSVELGVCAVQYALVDAITDPRRVRHRASEAQLYDWWDSYLSGAAEMKNLSPAA